MMWSEKYRPSSIFDMIGNEESRASLVQYLAKWKRGTKPVLLVGPPGTGKTTVANLAALQFGYDLIDLNASDIRSKSKINQLLNPVLNNAGIYNSPMIFIDEVDGIHGRADFGGVGALVKILKNPAVPIILAANSDASDKMKQIKKAVTTLYFKQVPPRLLRVYLHGILRMEGVELTPGSMIRSIIGSDGDIRSMLNMAQSFSTGFVADAAKSAATISPEDGVNAFFEADTLDEARRALYSMGASPQEKINAFYSSVVNAKMRPETRSAILRAISDADILYGRIMKTQQWRLLRYLNETLLGMYGSKAQIKYSKYNISWRLLNRIMFRGKDLQRISGILAEATHMSQSAVAAICLPYVMSMIGRGSLNLDLDGSLISAIKKEVAGS